jgi:hypothetical protein
MTAVDAAALHKADKVAAHGNGRSRLEQATKIRRTIKKVFGSSQRSQSARSARHEANYSCLMYLEDLE